MSENSSPPPDSSRKEDSLKSLVTKGVVGAVSLAGATAIPLIVQRYLGPSTPPSATPSPEATPAQVAAPSPSATAVNAGTVENQPQPLLERQERGESKKKKSKVKD